MDETIEQAILRHRRQAEEMMQPGFLEMLREEHRQNRERRMLQRLTFLQRLAQPAQESPDKPRLP